ncbi:MAG: hypothetical protein QGG88_00040 [Gammaproteobacteria bacterium]|jgi:hypothetical protein|nr:hypothetical protein [Gammaproteobacteria bacterium]
MLPKGIGPHEGIEFDLVKQGKKDLVLFFCDYPVDDHYAQAQQLGMSVLEFDHQDPYLDPQLKNVVFYRQGYRAQAEELVDMINLSLTRPDNWQQLEYRIGQLLGYSDHAIAVYLAHCQADK